LALLLEGRSRHSRRPSRVESDCVDDRQSTPHRQHERAAAAAATAVALPQWSTSHGECTGANRYPDICKRIIIIVDVSAYLQ
jgi:hypothetical protein